MSAAETQTGVGAPLRSIERRIVLPVSTDRAFHLLSDPLRLDELTPAWFRLRPLAVPARLEVGTTIEYRMRWRRLPLRWVSVMTDWQRPHVSTYEQLRGPYRFFRHEHLFRAVSAGTEVTDRIQFLTARLPLAPGLIQRELEAILDFRAVAAATAVQSAGDSVRQRGDRP